MGSSLVYAIGAARAQFQGRRYELPERAKYSCGNPHVYDVGVYLDGTASACCSGGFDKEADLGCGNIFRDDARTILEKVYGFSHVRLVKEIGLDRLYERVKRRRPDLLPKLPAFADVDTVCEVCSTLHGSPELRDELSPIVDELSAELAGAAMLARHMKEAVTRLYFLTKEVVR